MGRSNIFRTGAGLFNFCKHFVLEGESRYLLGCRLPLAGASPLALEDSTAHCSSSRPEKSKTAAFSSLVPGRICNSLEPQSEYLLCWRCRSRSISSLVSGCGSSSGSKCYSSQAPIFDQEKARHAHIKGGSGKASVPGVVAVGHEAFSREEEPLESPAPQPGPRQGSKERPRVVIVGRPNVGKSALFNRLTKTRDALVYNTPHAHVTRDHREGLVELGGLEFMVVDTAGMEPWVESKTVLGRTLTLTASVLGRCDLILFLLDARSGVVGTDTEVASWIRRTKPPGVPVLPVVNKAEGQRAEATSLVANIADAHAFGFGVEPVTLSAETGEGLMDLHDRLQELLPAADLDADMDAGVEDAAAQAAASKAAAAHADVEGAKLPAEAESAVEEGEENDDAAPLQLAIAGRPNVGKSTLLNRLLGRERVLTGPEPGLTRDAVHVEFEYSGRRVVLVDTAGWVQRSRLEHGPPTMSAVDARRSIARAQVVALVLDAVKIADSRRSMTATEVALAHWVTEEGRALVLVVNKMDRLDGPKQASVRGLVQSAVPKEVKSVLNQVSGLPTIFLSAKSGRGVDRLMPAVSESYGRWRTRLPTSRLNRWLQKVLTRHPRGGKGAHGGKIRFITQVKARPPTFVVFVTGSSPLDETDLRFIASALREDFGLGGIPLRVLQRHKKKGSDVA